MFQILWPSLRQSYNEDARAFGKHIEKFVRLICFAQWKQRRFAISFRVTAFDLDPKTGFRFPPVQEAFSREIAEMNSYIDSGLWKKRNIVMSWDGEGRRPYSDKKARERTISKN